MNVYATAKSDVGRVRERNEDAYVVQPELGLFGVADGMGGHKGGAHASRLTCEVVSQYLSEHREALESAPPPADDDASPPIARLLADAVRAACLAVYDAAAAEPELSGMGTTCTVMVVRPGWAYVAHVGDSRCYIQRGSRFMQVTEDHSLVNEQVRAGLLRPEEAAHSRLKNIITRSVGFEREVEVDTFLVPLENNDQFLLCSDGLSNLLENAELGEAMMAMHGNRLNEFLVNVALERGGDDNITVVSLRIDDPTLPHAATTDTDLVLPPPVPTPSDQETLPGLPPVVAEEETELASQTDPEGSLSTAAAGGFAANKDGQTDPQLDGEALDRAVAQHASAGKPLSVDATANESNDGDDGDGTGASDGGPARLTQKAADKRDKHLGGVTTDDALFDAHAAPHEAAPVDAPAQTTAGAASAAGAGAKTAGKNAPTGGRRNRRR